LAIFTILFLIVTLQIRTFYLKKNKADTLSADEKTILNAEQNNQNIVLQMIVKEQFQAANPENQNIPIQQRWNKMKKEIDRVHNHFTIRLRSKFPHLKEDEICLCCLIRIEMDVHWIITQLNISKEYFRIKKSRLAKTLQVQNNNKQLEKFIREF